MTQAEVETALTRTIEHVQRESRSDCPTVDGSTRPIGDLDGFDSLNGVEVGAKIAEDFGLQMPDNPFVDERGQTLTVKAAAERIVAANRNPRKSSGGAK
jgi:acyl carrier protein